ncbi:protein-cysteine N-palmitoyltransferase Rasp isoform X2 [Brevipalpus obovatus]|uniref:protein-cysteine N-palmitoyltransferase Rasp isoform X2 n=1 Tax=Brevipalpus obovatus TaxID=246614 RepID=UPI003D9E5945
MTKKNFESIVCLFVWTFSCLYSLYCFHWGSEAIKHHLDPEDFSSGFLPSREQDASDFEWTVFRNAVKNHWLLILGHILMSQIIQLFVPQVTVVFMIVYGSFTINCVLSPFVLLIFWLNILIAFCAHLSGIYLLPYLLCIGSFGILHGPQYIDIKRSLLDYDLQKVFLFDVLFAWLNAKCLSFSCDRNEALKKSKHDSTNILMILAYCMYFPTLFTGPIHQFHSFLENMRSHSKYSIDRTVDCLFKLIPMAGYAILYEVLTHYLFSSAVQFYPELTNMFDSWTLCGLGYCLPVLFHIKYYVLYGTAKALAEFDEIKIPPPPKCVSRIHSSTYLWRHFDRGLHLWLSRYFYKPIVLKYPSLFMNVLATFVSFFCVCLWHGMDKTIIAWCCLNFFCVVFEKVGHQLRTSGKVSELEYFS